MSFPENDTQFEDTLITSVDGDREHGWNITRSEGWCFGVPKDSPIVPKVGMSARFYGKGIGYTVRGLFLNGVEVFYRTEAIDAEYHRKQVEAERLRREIEYDAKRDEYDARVAELPEVFRQRFARFRAGNARFRYDFEPYELFTCEQALAIANTLRTSVAIDHFRRLPWDQQKTAVPGLSDEHSGNTFGCACTLAALYVERPEFVVRMHGALTPLVGCVEYGCTHEVEATR